ncbi:hypothetical protein C8R43DRAFT_1123551 [Mycena crocata]|nr:hypothetical protein C8R43DRAFT_1123551 [Mycena crocata]
MVAFLTFATSALLLSVSIVAAQDDSDVISDEDLCVLGCSISAGQSAGCGINDTACFCLSRAYTKAEIECATTKCGFSAKDSRLQLDLACSGFDRGGQSVSPSSSETSGQSVPAGQPSAANAGSSAAAPSGPSSAPASNRSSTPVGGSGSGSAATTLPASGSAPAPSPSGNAALSTAVGPGIGALSAAGLLFYALLA